jgi:ornithine cyclodeaminase/alanine dehydrogenase-like protein (mu-crystallin family)
LTIVPEDAVRKVATREIVFAAVRKALIAVATSDGQVFPVTQGRGADWAFGVKAGQIESCGILGFKFGGYWPGNRARGLPSHNSMTVLIDRGTGFPRALVGATYLNGLRTAAADAVAVEALARPDAAVLGVLGAGHQAEFEIRAVADVRKLRLVKLWNRTPAAAQALLAKLADLEAEVVVAARDEAVRGSDIVVTISAADEPLVQAGEVDAGTHISAMGADQAGKQELATKILIGAKLFADWPDQSVVIGEYQHAAREGLVSHDAIIPLGRVLTGAAPGRQDADDITVFDSSGVAFQDLFAADAVLERASEAGLTSFVEL